MDLDINLNFLFFRWKISISRQWIQFGIIAGVVLLSTYISFWGSYRIKMLIPIVLGGLGGLIVLLKQMRIGFLLVLVAGMFIPFTGPGGVNATVLMVALLLGLWLMEMLVVKRRFLFVQSPVMLPVILLLVVSFIAFWMGQLPWFVFADQAPLDSQIGGFAIFVFSLGLMAATVNLIDIKWLQLIVWTFIGFGAIYIFGRAFRLPVDRLYQLGFTANSMFWTWLVALSFSQAFLNNKLKRNVRGLLLLITLVTFYVALVQGYDWKSGWVPPLAVIVVILALKYPRLVLLAIPFALMAAGYLIVGLIASDEYSWGTRVDAWIIVLEISKASPIFGLGFSNYYFYTPLFPIRGWQVSFNSHSQYVDLLAQVGFLGLFCFFWVFYEVGRTSWKMINRVPDGFAQSYSYGVLAGIVGTLVASFLVDWVLPFVYNIGFNGFRASVLPWIFMGGMVAIENAILGSKQNL
jgi:O-antigen ligase